MVGDHQIRDAPDWSNTLRYKILALGVLERRVLEQIAKTSSEFEEVQKSMKVRPFREYFELIVMYEAFLNSVYSLFENISHFVRLVYPRRNLPWGFSDQRKKFLENSNLDKTYSEILEKTKWYDEISSARSETVHFLSGRVIINAKNGLGYSISNPQSRRVGTHEKISVSSIEQYVKETQTNVNQFLKEFADHFLEVIDQDSRATFVCVSSSDDVIGARSYSLKEYLRREHGVCELGGQSCPESNYCKAKKK